MHRNKDDLILHQKIYDGAAAVIVQECPLFGFITKEVAEVDVHMKQKHGIDIHRCNKCEHIAKDKADLQKPVKELMGMKRAMGCGHCNFSGITDSILTDHINSKHKFSEVFNKPC